MNCKNCGQEIAKKAVVCPSCGCKIKKPIYKKWWFWVLIVIIAIAIGGGIGSSNTKDQGKDEAKKTEKSDTAIGDFSLTVDSCRLAKDYEGKDIVIVKYIFENVSSDESQSFSWAFDDNVYQNGVGLNECYIASDSANYSIDNQTKEIQKGASIEVEAAYELNDTTTDISVEVKELFSFDDETIKKTFSIQ